jgi:hypothetical protein
MRIGHQSEDKTWPVRPYQTLLLLPPSSPRNGVLPLDSSGVVQRLIEMAKPTKNFGELQLETEIPLSHLLKCSAHLVHWKRGKIINNLARINIYVLNPYIQHTGDDFYFKLSEEFSQTFGRSKFKFEEMIAVFDAPKTLGEHLDAGMLTPSLQRDFVEVVVWMLQRNLLMQLHTFVYLIIPLSTPTMTLLTPPPSYQHPAQPSPLQPQELEYLNRFDDKSNSFQLLKR